LKHLTLEMESYLGNVSLASVAINAICLHAGLNVEQSNQIELCIVEALTNVILHAYQGEEHCDVVIEVSVDRERLAFDLYDTGVAMGADKVDSLINGERAVEPEIIDPTALPEGGRGLQIIRSVMDEVAYTREGNTNHLNLTKWIPTQA
jgi:serine/threonine-protein kinase RsbW